MGTEQIINGFLDKKKEELMKLGISELEAVKYVFAFSYELNEIIKKEIKEVVK